MQSISRITAFEGSRRIASGDPASVANAVREAISDGQSASILIFDDQTGVQIDLNLREELGSSMGDHSSPASSSPEQRSAGRPRLGVVAREVTLLPRHWDWLNKQRGGASAALRRLVDEARKSSDSIEARQAVRDALYRFMTAISGNAPGYEEALRNLFSGNLSGFKQATANWPADIRSFMDPMITSAFEAVVG